MRCVAMNLRELKRGILRGLVLSLLIMLGGCMVSMFGCATYQYLPTTPQPAAPPDPNPVIRDAGLDSVTMDFLSTLRVRYNNHPSLPDRELVLCLYGVVRGDTAIVTSFRPTKQTHASAVLTYPEPCYQLRPEFFGQVRYLGTWHNHWGGVDCGFSDYDNESFYTDPHAIIDVVTCSTQTIWRGKRR